MEVGLERETKVIIWAILPDISFTCLVIIEQWRNMLKHPMLLLGSDFFLSWTYLQIIK